MSATKIKKIQVNNFRSIQEQELVLNGCTAIVIGGNNKGKSTLTRALIDRFRGIKPEYIVNYDALEGTYRMELTTGEVLNWWLDTKGNEKLSIISNGKKEKITKEMMQYYFPSSFDVDKFLNETPGKQRKTLEKLSGLDFSDVDKAYKEAYENRSYYNKRVAEDEAIKNRWEPHWVNEIRSVDHIEKELDDIEKHNLNFQTVNLKLQTKKDQLEKAYSQIEELKRRIELLQEEAMQLETEIDKGVNWISNPEKQPKSEEYKKSLKAQFLDIEANNDTIQELQQYNKNKNYAEQANEDIKRILTDKDEMIRLSNMPEGFSFSDDGILYNSLPFDKKNQSSSALYIGALKLATQCIGEVRAVHFDASYLDKNSLSSIQEWAENNNLQLLIERPDWDGGPITYELVEDLK